MQGTRPARTHVFLGRSHCCLNQFLQKGTPQSLYNTIARTQSKNLCIPPTYVEEYIFFGFSVHSFICSYVLSSFCHVHGTRVKVFASKFIRHYIIKTLYGISFIFGMMVDIGLKFYSVPSPPGA